MAHLVFDNHSHTLTLHGASGSVIGSWTAYNNAQRSSRGPFPIGTYSYSHHNLHPGNGPDGPYGSYGILVFDVPGRSGMGVHSGRSTRRDLAGRSGPAYATDGCIRTTDAAMGVIDTTHSSDRIRHLEVR